MSRRGFGTTVGEGRPALSRRVCPRKRPVESNARTGGFQRDTPHGEFTPHVASLCRSRRPAQREHGRLREPRRLKWIRKPPKARPSWRRWSTRLRAGGRRKGLHSSKGELPWRTAARSSYPGPQAAFWTTHLEQRGWRWSTEDPLVPTGNCAFPFGDCRLKDPTELHLTLWVKPWPGEEDYRSPPWPPPGPPGFFVEPIAGLEGYKVHLTWLSSFPRSDGHRADQGGAGFLVTPGTDGWVVEVVLTWDT